MKKKWISLAIIFAFVVAVVIGGVFYWRHARFYPTTEDAYVNGDIYPIAARIPGTIQAVYVTDNQVVEKGQKIADLDPSDYDKAIEKAQAGMAEATAALAADRALIAQTAAQVDAAKSRLDLAKIDLKRFTELHDRNSIPKQRYDQAVTTEQVAAADYTSMKKALAAAEAKLSVAEKKVNVIKVQLSNAELQRTYCTIYAPAAGTISKKSAEVGQVVAPGQPMCAVVPMKGASVWIEANFKETQLDRIKPGQSVTFHTDVQPDRTYHGWVESLSAGTGATFSLLPPENATGNWVKVVQRLPVRIAVDPKSNSDHSLRLGLSVHVEVDTLAPPKHVSQTR